MPLTTDHRAGARFGMYAGVRSSLLGKLFPVWPKLALTPITDHDYVELSASKSATSPAFFCRSYCCCSDTDMLPPAAAGQAAAVSLSGDGDCDHCCSLL